MADYQAEILVRGKPIKMFYHKGEFYIEGRKGSSFELRFTNNTWKNIEVVPSVDGLSVLNGEACGEDSEGYLVPARDSVTIPGWRLNNSAVAEFVFKDKNRSYAKQSGEGTMNVGVIGFMVFKEKVHAYVPNPIFTPRPWKPNTNPWNPNPNPWDPNSNPYYASNTRGVGSATDTNSEEIGSLNISDSVTIKGDDSGSIHNMSLGSASISSTDIKTSSRRIVQDSFDIDNDGVSEPFEVTETFNIGTGWGDEVEHNVSVVDFERQNPMVADELIAVYYDTRKGLEARGIKVVKERRKKAQDLPNAFPTYSETGAKPPSGWKGKKR